MKHLQILIFNLLYMKNHIAIIVCILILSACRAEVKNVRLHGSLKEFNTTEVKMEFGGAAGEISDFRTILIPVEKDGLFNLTFPLEQAAYYQVGRNTLYLTPGDDMEVYLADNQTKSTFKGEGAEANKYLTERLFPKSGSFLEAGRNLRSDFVSTKQVIDSLATLREKELQELSSVSKEFRELEMMRIKADIVNSYLCYPLYQRTFFEGCDSREEYNKRINGFYNIICEEVNPLLKEISASDKYLDIAVVRQVLVSSYAVTAFDFPKSKRLAELYKTIKKGKSLDQDITPELYKELNMFTDSLENKDFGEALRVRIEKRAKLMIGRPAIDLTLITPAGEQKKLSDYKGATLYVDFWATWCGPCMGEMPYYNELSKKYPDIRFIGISLDDNEEAWRRTIDGGDHGNVIELLCHDPKVRTEWDIIGIPRFLLIDKDFNIISADAPYPSQQEKIVPLLESNK